MLTQAAISGPASPWMGDIADALADARVAIVRDAFAPDVVGALRREAFMRDRAGRTRRAGVGRREALHTDDRVRGDRIAWLDDESPVAAERSYLEVMATLRDRLNRDLMIGIDELEAHYAIYPAGARYARHRDRFRDDDARRVSLVLYLNESWMPEDGGALRVYLPNGATLDVAPLGGTLVAFSSDAFEHEVLPATRERVALTGWLRGRAA